MNSRECVQETGIRCSTRDKDFREKLNAFLSPSERANKKLENNCRRNSFVEKWKEGKRRTNSRKSVSRLNETFKLCREIKSYQQRVVFVTLCPSPLACFLFSSVCFHVLCCD